MSQKTTAEQKAEERYPSIPINKGVVGAKYTDLLPKSDMYRREGFCTCYTEQVEPRNRMMQELVDALNQSQDVISRLSDGPDRAPWGPQLDINDASLAKAKEQFRITPTNTTE